MIGTPDDGGLAFRSIVRDDGDDDDDNDDEDGDDDREHGGDIASRPSISAIRLPGSTNSRLAPGRDRHPVPARS